MGQVLTDLQRQLRERDQQVTELQRQLKESSEQVTDLKGQLAAKDQQVFNLQGHISGIEEQKTARDRLVTHLQGEMSARYQEVTDLHVQLTVRYQQVTDLHEELTAKYQQFTDLQRQLPTSYQQAVNLQGQPQRTTKREQVVDMQSKLTARAQRVTDLEGQGTERDQQVTYLQRQVTAKQRRVTDLERQVTVRGQEVSDLQRQATARERQVTDLEGEITAKHQEVADLQRQVTEGIHQITDLQRQVTERDQTVTNLQGQVTTREQQVSDLQRQLLARNQQITNLQGQLTARDRAGSMDDRANRLDRTYSNENTQEIQQDWVINRNEIILKEDQLLGEGAWGRVVRGKFRRSNVAVKQIHEVLLSPYSRAVFEREVGIASRCRHPCLLQFIGATNDDEGLLLVTELMNRSLRSLYEDRPLTERQISVISMDVAQALNYLHQNKPDPIIHRDINSANVLLWQQGDQWRGKVSDYGTANVVRHCTSDDPGAVIYCAPEAISGVLEQIISCKVDVYSFGVLLCEMCIRELPDPQQREIQISRMRNHRQFQQIVEHCLQIEPGARPNMEEIIDELE